MQRATCVVCGNPLPTGYRGRPRVTCGSACYNKRRTLKAHNREALDATQTPLLQVVQLLAVWPALQLRAIELLTSIREQDDEVVLCDWLEGKGIAPDAPFVGGAEAFGELLASQEGVIGYAQSCAKSSAD